MSSNIYWKKNNVTHIPFKSILNCSTIKNTNMKYPKICNAVSAPHYTFNHNIKHKCHTGPVPGLQVRTSQHAGTVSRG
jgi:hypothetical protein